MLRLLLRFLLLCGIAETVKTDTYKKAGGKAVLSPGSVPGPITSITWKHNADIAVEWYEQDVSEYRDFKGRCELDLSTGALTISNLSPKDSGRYTAEINNKIMDTTEITVITAVPKPTISKQCNSEVTQCMLTCEADITDDAKPISYNWTMGDMVTQSPTNQLRITKDDPELTGKLISCQLENPVSSERSDDIISPFTNGSSAGVIIAVVVVLVLIALGVVAGYFIWRNRKAKSENAGCHQCFAQFDPRNCLKCGAAAGTAEEGIPLEKAQNNGAATFSVDNELHDHNQNLGCPDAKNETQEPMVDSEDKETSDPEKESAVISENSNETELPTTTSAVQEELSQDQMPPRSADTSSRSDE